MQSAGPGKQGCLGSGRLEGPGRQCEGRGLLQGLRAEWLSAKPPNHLAVPPKAHLAQEAPCQCPAQRRLPGHGPPWAWPSGISFSGPRTTGRGTCPTIGPWLIPAASEKSPAVSRATGQAAKGSQEHTDYENRTLSSKGACAQPCTRYTPSPTRCRPRRQHLPHSETGPGPKPTIWFPGSQGLC